MKIMTTFMVYSYDSLTRLICANTKYYKSTLFIEVVISNMLLYGNTKCLILKKTERKKLDIFFTFYILKFYLQKLAYSINIKTRKIANCL